MEEIPRIGEATLIELTIASRPTYGHARKRLMRNVGQIVAMRHKTKAYASGLLILCIVMSIGYFAPLTNRNVTVHDNGFEILDCFFSKGMTPIYRGNQTVGRMRAKLNRQLGLKFIGLSQAIMTGTPEIHVVVLRYKGDFPFEELDGLRAVLTNGKNISKELPGVNVPRQAEQMLVGLYILPKLPTSDDSFRIDFKLKSTGDPIASWRVGKLYQRNKELNSDL